MTICTKKAHGPKSTGAKSERAPRHAEVTISGCSYADIAKQLRTTANPNQTGVNIWSLDETRSGETRIRVMGGKDMAAKLCEAIRPNGVTVRTRQRKTAVQASRLEDECSEEDIKRAIMAALKTTQTSAEIVSLRALRGKSMRATIIMDEDEAKKLVELPRVLVGIISTNFRVQKMLDAHPPREVQRARPLETVLQLRA